MTFLRPIMALFSLVLVAGLSAGVGYGVEFTDRIRGGRDGRMLEDQ